MNVFFFFFFNNDGETARNFHIVHFFCLLFLFLFLLFFHIFHSFYHPLIHVLIQMRESILFFAPLTMGNFLQGCEFLNEEFTLGFVNGSRVWTLWMGSEVVVMDFMWAGQISWVRVMFFVALYFEQLIGKRQENNEVRLVSV